MAEGGKNKRKEEKACENIWFGWIEKKNEKWEENL